MTHQGSFLVPKDEESKLFLLTRGSAIEHYAMVEQSLLTLFAHLLGTSKDAAGVAFFRINNSRATFDVIKRLLNKKYGNTYNIFWNSVGKALKPLADERNKIVHWIVEGTTRATRAGINTTGNGLVTTRV